MLPVPTKIESNVDDPELRVMDLLAQALIPLVEDTGPHSVEIQERVLLWLNKRFGEP
jgi:hypothetical protein